MTLGYATCACGGGWACCEAVTTQWRFVPSCLVRCMMGRLPNWQTQLGFAARTSCNWHGTLGFLAPFWRRVSPPHLWQGRGCCAGLWKFPVPFFGQCCRLPHSQVWAEGPPLVLRMDSLRVAGSPALSVGLRSAQTRACRRTAGSRTASQLKLASALLPWTMRVATANGTENLAASVLWGALPSSSAARW